MKPYVIFLRGINVGGKNKVSMAVLKECLHNMGFSNVRSYIASGNILLESDKPAATIKTDIEQILPQRFKLDSELIKVLVLSHHQLKTVVDKRPKGFGDQPDKYHSDVIFLMDIDVNEALKVFNPREGVDTIWPGDGVIYSQRLSAERSKSRLSKIVGTVPYQSMTIRNRNTVTKLLQILDKIDE